MPSVGNLCTGEQPLLIQERERKPHLPSFTDVYLFAGTHTLAEKYPEHCSNRAGIYDNCGLAMTSYTEIVKKEP